MIVGVCPEQFSPEQPRETGQSPGQLSRSPVYSSYSPGLVFHLLPTHLHLVIPLSLLFLSPFFGGFWTDFSPRCASHLPACLVIFLDVDLINDILLCAWILLSKQNVDICFGRQ